MWTERARAELRASGETARKRDPDTFEQLTPQEVRIALFASSGASDITTIDGPQMLKTLHTYPLLFRGASLIRGGVETRPTAADPRRGDFIRPTREVN